MGRWPGQCNGDRDSADSGAGGRVFAGGGWPPQSIAASARQMVVTNDLGRNTSRGAFRYDPADTSAFVAGPWRAGSRTPALGDRSVPKEVVHVLP